MGFITNGATPVIDITYVSIANTRGLRKSFQNVTRVSGKTWKTRKTKKMQPRRNTGRSPPRIDPPGSVGISSFEEEIVKCCSGRKRPRVVLPCVMVILSVSHMWSGRGPRRNRI